MLNVECISKKSAEIRCCSPKKIPLTEARQQLLAYIHILLVKVHSNHLNNISIVLAEKSVGVLASRLSLSLLVEEYEYTK